MAERGEGRGRKRRKNVTVTVGQEGREEEREVNNWMAERNKGKRKKKKRKKKNGAKRGSSGRKKVEDREFPKDEEDTRRGRIGGRKKRQVR